MALSISGFLDGGRIRRGGAITIKIFRQLAVIRQRDFQDEIKSTMWSEALEQGLIYSFDCGMHGEGVGVGLG